MSSLVSSTGKKLSTDAAIDYIRYMEESWLLLPFENFVGKLQDKEMNRKYYFIDNYHCPVKLLKRKKRKG